MNVNRAGAFNDQSFGSKKAQAARVFADIYLEDSAESLGQFTFPKRLWLQPSILGAISNPRKHFPWPDSVCPRFLEFSEHFKNDWGLAVQPSNKEMHEMFLTCCGQALRNQDRVP